MICADVEDIAGRDHSTADPPDPRSLIALGTTTV